MTTRTFTKYPADVIDVDIDVLDYLPSSDNIATATCTADTGLTVGVSTINTSTKSVKQWLSGGTAGTTYDVRVTVTSDEGRVKYVPFRIAVLTPPTIS